MNRNKFQQIAKQFRAGKIPLEEFTQQVLAREDDDSYPMQKNGESEAETSDLPFALPSRRANSHKGEFGRVLVVGGSQGMTGAAVLTGLAALRSGAGTVTLAVPQSCQAVAASFNPCLMTVGLPEVNGKLKIDFEDLHTLAKNYDVVALGPGLQTSHSLSKAILELYLELERPMIVDADGINNLAKEISVPEDLAQHPLVRILTPHPGEFHRLTGKKFSDRNQMCAAADDFAGQANSIVVLKGNRTHVTDGEKSFTNETGNPGMATAGSGDVLTGVIASLVAQKMAPFEATVNACFAHGKAGDFAASELGQLPLIATDLIEILPEALS